MQLFNSYGELTSFHGPSAVAIGIFDGVHRGHRALLTAATELAQEDGLTSVAYTFHPHPAQVLNPALAPQLIEPLAQRVKRIAALGLGAMLVGPFSKEFAATSADIFVRDILVHRLHVKHVVVGEGFTFGRRQAGNVALLQELGAELGFAVHPITHVRADGIEASSTKIRDFVHQGQMDGATLLLTRPFALFGTVVHGAKRGSGLGFPTANLQVDNELFPKGGVYAGYGNTPHGRYPAVINIGVAPTFGASTQVRVEAHLLDYQGPQLYDATMSIDLVAHLRDEQKFADIAALTRQIHADIAAGRAKLQ